MQKKTLTLFGIILTLSASLCGCGNGSASATNPGAAMNSTVSLADNEVIIEDKVVQVTEEGLKEMAQELDGVTDSEGEAGKAASISLDDCRLWTLFDDFEPITSSFCDEVRQTFLFPGKAEYIGRGKIALDGAYPTNRIAAEFEQLAHAERFSEVIYENGANKIYKEEIMLGAYYYFIEPGYKNWMSVKLFVEGDQKNEDYLNFLNEFVPAFEKSLSDYMENPTAIEENNGSNVDGQSIVFADMIGEYTASNGTKLWIATPFGEYDISKGPMTVEFIKEHDIAWTDSGAEYDGNSVTCYDTMGQKVYITKTGEDTITVEIFNGDKAEYKLTNPGYEYYNY